MLPDTQPSIPIRVFRLLVITLIVVQLVGVVVAGLRLGLALNHPMAGFVMTWEKSVKLLTVSWLTPPNWTGVDAGIRINDNILCMDGYNPSPTSVVYGLGERYADITCPNGGKHYTEILQERYENGASSISFLVERNGELLPVEEVPIVLFTVAMLLELFLPPALLALSAIVVAIIVFRANSSTMLNLLFAIFVTLIAAAMCISLYTVRISSIWEDMRIAALILAVPWLPFLGAILLHLVFLLADYDQRSWGKGLLSFVYALSLIFSLIGIFIFLFNDHPWSFPITTFYDAFNSWSYVLVSLLALVVLQYTLRTTESRRVRNQIALIVMGLTISLLLAIPYIVFLLSNASVIRYAGSTPFFGFIVIALFAYAILRYQLFRARTTVLTGLIVLSFCMVVTTLVSWTTSFFPVFLSTLSATILTSAGLEANRGPMSFFQRLLRREQTDYMTIVRLSEDLGQSRTFSDVDAAVQQTFRKRLEVSSVKLHILPQDYRVTGPTEELRAKRSTKLDAIDVLQDVKTWWQDLLPQSILTRFCDDLSSASVAVWVPLLDQQRLVGMVTLGQRWTGELYDDKDLNLIEVLAHVTALAILNIQQNERTTLLLKQVVQVQENEQMKISQELHNTILPFLQGLTYRLGDVGASNDSAQLEIAELQEQISIRTDRLREVITFLRAPEKLVQSGLIHSLQSWLMEVERLTNAEIQFDYDPSVQTDLSTEASVAIYKTIREAVHNAMKHARASTIRITISRDQRETVFAVSDDGRGFDLQQTPSVELKGYSSLHDMRIYIEKVNGQLEIQTVEGSGTKVEGRVPTQGGAKSDAERRSSSGI